jgi:hypothetical protein
MPGRNNREQRTKVWSWRRVRAASVTKILAGLPKNKNRKSKLEIVQKMSFFLPPDKPAKRNDSSGVGIAEGGARTLDLEVGNIMG